MTSELKFVEIPRRALIHSLILHVSVLILIGGLSGLEKLGIQIFPRRKSPFDIYQTHIQVDMVGLPEHLIHEKFKFDPTLPVSDKPYVPPVPPSRVTEKGEDQKDDLVLQKKYSERAIELKRAQEESKKLQLEQSKALKSLKVQAQREEALKALAKAKKETEGRPKIAGNILSKGSATVGKIGSNPAQYGDLIRQKIHACFDIFEWQNKRDLVTDIHFELLADGRVAKPTILSPSKNTLYDSAVKKAVLACQPYPLPTDLSIIEGGITVTFRPLE